jgi:hypothetical protein
VIVSGSDHRDFGGYVPKLTMVSIGGSVRCKGAEMSAQAQHRLPVKEIAVLVEERGSVRRRP